MLSNRDDILRNALEKNQDETTRWEKYKNEQEIAIQNLEQFSKRLTVDVMVEMGKKALIPGKLIHTNDVFVSHFEGYFSNCSAFQAKQICEMRLKKSEEYLAKLQAEAQMWQDSLHAPHDEGVFASEGQVDIVEEYDEEKEKEWRGLHRKRVREYKMREKNKRREEVVNENKQIEQDSPQEHYDDEVFSNEVQTRNLQCDDKIKGDENIQMEQDTQEVPHEQILSLEKIQHQTIRKLQSNEEVKKEKLLNENVQMEQHIQKAPHEEILLLEKSKDLETIFHDNAQREHEENEFELIKDNTISFDTIKQLMGDNNVTQKKRRVAHVANTDGTKKNDVNESVTLKNKDLVLNEQDVNTEIIDDEESEIHSEVKDIIQQAKSLPLQDQLKFLKKHLLMFEEEHLEIKIKSSEDIEKKIHIQEICQQLWDFIYSSELISNYKTVLDIDENTDDENTNSETKIGENPAEKKLKKSVSFPFEDEVLEYQKIDTVADMLKFIKPLNVGENTKVENRKEKISKKVEENLKYISENQSIQNCNLIDQIITESTNEIYTSYIQVKHSSAPTYKNISTDNNNHDEVPTSPADIYINYLKTCDVNSKNCVEEQEPDVNVPILCEKERIRAFKSPKEEFSVPKNSQITSSSSEGKALKSILRNKINVENERPQNEKAQVKPMDVPNCRGIFDKVVKDVKEHKEPDPLPKGKFVNAHAPKIRISNFKRDREKIKQT
ncbi:unconventional prefoldin RPB5 interactor-like protein [Teleopsis dalmanni]|uniref:unconventional prefoldin RPB5 interactor-like protein n=1 Tax=Teleopsis dalmanni TaxID=139649 RepID=UPI0018CFE16B|nr:unconventional prefoldin RPB5 interactor-like protein [Teleopsis dalmanni]